MMYKCPAFKAAFVRLCAAAGQSPPRVQNLGAPVEAITPPQTSFTDDNNNKDTLLASSPLVEEAGGNNLPPPVADAVDVPSVAAAAAGKASPRDGMSSKPYDVSIVS
mmetsp:Transcript_17572/g.49656  ORF Transcript_17572/g.49656 Transcript_17572/m.49656 type:complete len:107 (-) Transcript_17572:8168-8488(-)